MDLPDDWEGPIHHQQFPISEHGDQATEADNLYATQTGSDAHEEFHRIYGATDEPYPKMEPGFDEEGMKHVFDFANTAPKPGRGSVSCPTGSLSADPTVAAEDAEQEWLRETGPPLDVGPSESHGFSQGQEIDHTAPPVDVAEPPQADEPPEAEGVTDFWFEDST